MMNPDQMERPHICHLTVLNPALHPRIFHKLAQSQRILGYRVTVLGQDESSIPYDADGVDIIPVSPFHRASWKRWLFSVRFARKALVTRADVYVIHTPELLPLGAYLRWKSDAKLIYDMHESYSDNLMHAPYLPSWIRGVLSDGWRRFERMAISKWVDGVSLAERCYQPLLEGLDVPNLVLENRYLSKNHYSASTEGTPYLLYTGTLAANWGLWHLMEVWEEMRQVRPCRLVIAGFSHDQTLLKDLADRISRSPFSDEIELIGGSRFVPYDQVQDLISNCVAGFGLYEPMPHLIQKIPTKFFEYRFHQKPLIYPDVPTWRSFWEGHGIAWTPVSSGETLWEELDQVIPTGDPSMDSWESQVPDLDKWMEGIVISNPLLGETLQNL
ncbi:glycosyltransferase [Pontibacter sp. G13]|uniref:glycosyltransferase n=1 Tax=Pontibacter sp. G13 TaxID=3074898 RepID=UPI00288BBABB|nr:glycosyltransferase [Pontibacter sp. G13]WNJ20972.1 glycosyltransferase [Pontibacter sp. G13]